jgi:copper chaperone
MESVTLKVSGMSCQGCVRNITGVLQAIDGVKSAEVSLEDAQARVQFSPDKVALARLREAIEDAGFDVE